MAHALKPPGSLTAIEFHYVTLYLRRENKPSFTGSGAGCGCGRAFFQAQHLPLQGRWDAMLGEMQIGPAAPEGSSHFTRGCFQGIHGEQAAR